MTGTEFVFKAYKTSPPDPCSDVVIVPLSEGPSVFKAGALICCSLLREPSLVMAEATGMAFATEPQTGL